jgi:hypothetical protein
MLGRHAAVKTVSPLNLWPTRALHAFCIARRYHKEDNPKMLSSQNKWVGDPKHDHREYSIGRRTDLQEDPPTGGGFRTFSCVLQLT